MTSVCLPRIFYKFDANYVEEVFCELFGPDATGNSCVDRIDVIERTDRNTGEPFNVVFIHFSEYMVQTEFIMDFVNRINNDEEVKIQYNPPWFWKVRKNKAMQKNVQAPRPRIMSKRDEDELMAAQKQIQQERGFTETVPVPNPTVIEKPENKQVISSPDKMKPKGGGMLGGAPTSSWASDEEGE